MGSFLVALASTDQLTRGPVNAHLISGHRNAQKAFAKVDIAIKLVKENQGSSFIQTLWTFITQTRPCNIQQYFTAVKILIFR